MDEDRIDRLVPRYVLAPSSNGSGRLEYENGVPTALLVYGTYVVPNIDGLGVSISLRATGLVFQLNGRALYRRTRVVSSLFVGVRVCYRHDNFSCSCGVYRKSRTYVRAFRY